MSRFKKLINIIYYLMAIFVLMILLLILYSTIDSRAVQYVGMMLANEEFLEVAGGIGLFILIVVTIKLIVTILKRTDERYLFLYEDSGEIRISDTVIEKTVKNALREFEEVIEYTVKIKIKNKNKDNTKVNVNVKCGLDESICEAKGYYKEITNTNDENELKIGEDENLTVENLDSSDSNVNIGKKSVEKEEISKEKKDLSEGEIEASKKDGEGEENSIQENTDSTTEKDKTLAPEILEAMNVISEDNESDKEDDFENTSEEVQTLKTDESKVLKEKENAESNQEKDVEIYESYMNMDDLCSEIQNHVHDALEELISQRAGKVNIKFYEVRIREKTKKITNKGTSKSSAKNGNKRNKRVN